MVGVTIKHNIQWRGPGPLWMQQSTVGMRNVNDALSAKPTILRFATDNFMDDLIDTLADRPQNLIDYIARPETWREPMEAPSQQPIKENETGISRIVTRTHNRARLLAEAKSDKAKTHTAKEAAQRHFLSDDKEFHLPLKLFQPAHQRYYLVSASLVKNETGLPDYKVQPTNQEKASYIMRRLVPPEDASDDKSRTPDDSWEEYAFVQTSRGAVWKSLGKFDSPASKLLVNQEEQHSLFPSRYAENCCDRTIYSGLIPVGKREAWMAAPAEGEADSISSSESITGKTDSLAKAIFVLTVAEPWRALINQADFQRVNQLNSEPLPEDISEDEENKARDDKQRAFRTLRDQIQTGSWYILLDFADFLGKYFPDLYSVITGDAASDSLSDDLKILYEILVDTKLSSSFSKKLLDMPYPNSTIFTPNNLVEALATIGDYREKLESASNDFIRFNEDESPFHENESELVREWPNMWFPLADAEFSAPVPPTMTNAAILNATPEAQRDELTKADFDKTKLEALVNIIADLLPPTEKDYGNSTPLPTSQLDQKKAPIPDSGSVR